MIPRKRPGDRGDRKGREGLSGCERGNAEKTPGVGGRGEKSSKKKGVKLEPKKR